MNLNHQFWMSEAIKTAKESTTEVPIAAIIVSNGLLISKATNKIEAWTDSTAHAEMIAIKEASQKLKDWRLNNCIIYTTLEPCTMCAGAIINSRISKVVFGAYDIEAGACGTKLNIFKDLNKEKKIELIGGILEEEASKVLKDFFKAKRS